MKDKKDLLKSTNISRSSLYYKKVLPSKDWKLKIEIEKILRSNPSYGHRRIAQYLKINKKRVSRVMNLYGIKPYRRRKTPKKKDVGLKPQPYPNLLMLNIPCSPNHIWASDFTYLPYRGKFIYLATILDIYTRRIVGFSILDNHNTQLVTNALFSSLMNNSKPEIIHSDQGREYTSKQYLEILERLGINISMSKKGSPWENGYQESFYSQFKIELGDPNRFNSKGELIAEIYRLIYYYNNTRIHSSLGTSPVLFGRCNTKLSESLS